MRNPGCSNVRLIFATLLAGCLLAGCLQRPVSGELLAGSMVTIPGGRFLMGGSEEGAQEDELPLHEVAVKTFRMGRVEVTVGQFRRFVAATGYRTEAERDVTRTGCITKDLISNTWVRGTYNWRDPGYAQSEQFPVACVSWDDAQAYIAWLNAKTPGHFRLPTEAEWEYAARAGTTSKYFWGQDTSRGCEFANGADRTPWPNGTGKWATKMECDDHHFYAAPVGTYKPNAFGLFDMSGNVWEWVQDCYHDNYVGAPSDGSDWRGGQCKAHGSRGGSWHSSPGLSVANREWNDATSDRFGNQGFRIAQDP